MVLLTYCIPCQHGMRDACLHGQPAPEGMLGGWRCRCEGECVERYRPFLPESIARALTAPEKQP